MIMLLGPRGSGKTTLIKRLDDDGGFEKKDKEFDGVCPSVAHTSGTSLGGYTSLSGQRVALREVGSTVFPLWKDFFDEPDKDKAMYLMDGTNRNQIAEVSCQLIELLRSKKFNKSNLALVVNKCDCPELMKNAEISDSLFLDQLAASMEKSEFPSIFKISVVKEDGLQKLKEWMDG